MVINQEVVIFLSLHNNIIDNSKKQNATDFSVAFRLYYGSILFDVGELHQHLFCIKKYRKDTL
ncbi:hypothetical protein, partial [Enterococcus faecium]|uniref:hypothetical protein n=1 Tax=Enterococcus faecium TaxID=1352 RepID=UPI001A9227F4